MARGKYGAQAANRIARLDNELLQDKIAEIADLKRQVAERDRELAKDQVERDAVIVARGDALSSKLVAAAQSDALKMKTECDQVKRETAEWLAHYFNNIREANPEAAVIPRDINAVLGKLVGADSVGEYLAVFLPGFNNRNHKRLSLGNTRSNNADSRRPEWAKGVSQSGYLVPVQ